MKKFTFLGVLFIGLILSGCNGSNNKSTGGILSGDKPPNVIVEIDGEGYESILGSYCWDISKGTSKCVDTAGSVDLLKDKEPIKVKAGENITLRMDYTPKPSEIHFTQINNGNQTEIELDDNQFMAPDEKGVYFYDYGVWWMDEKIENTSHGSSSYAFAIEVK